LPSRGRSIFLMQPSGASLPASFSGPWCAADVANVDLDDGIKCGGGRDLSR
jgi:hypothetical protein